jgi:hypothetical protein
VLTATLTRGQQAEISFVDYEATHEANAVEDDFRSGVRIDFANHSHFFSFSSNPIVAQLSPYVNP